jgi:hypothetical protein
MVVTKHAEERMRKRLGLKRKAVERLAQTALTDGVPHADTTGSLHRYLDLQALGYDRKCKWRIYGNNLYAFTFNDVLITVVPLTARLMKGASKSTNTCDAPQGH